MPNYHVFVRSGESNQWLLKTHAAPLAASTGSGVGDAKYVAESAGALPEAQCEPVQCFVVEESQGRLVDLVPTETPASWKFKGTTSADQTL